MKNRFSGSMCRIDSRRRAAFRRGFTLLELLLVLAILVVIVGIVGTNLGTANTDARVSATKAQLEQLKNSVNYYKIRMNRLPESLEELRDGPSDSELRARWSEPIIEKIPTDAWDNQLAYALNGGKYEIRSPGNDGQANTEDDIIVEGS